MQQNNDHIKQFNASDIQRYLKGEMSASEMHELERSALEDPFLADAIEGYSRQYGEASADADLASLRQKFEAEHSNPGIENSKPAPVVQMKKNYWWRVAAIFIALAGTGALVFSLLNNNGSETQSLARKENQSPTVPVQPGSSAEALKDTTAAVPPSVVMNQSAKPAGHALSKSAEPEKKARAEAKEEAVVSSDAAASNKLEEVVVIGYGNQAKRASNEKAVQAFKGKITDRDNQPIEGASVSMNNKPAAVSDKEGNFLVRAPDTTVKVRVTSEGYETESVTLRSKAPSTPIKLEETLQGKAAGVSSNSERSKRKAVTYAPADPVIGRPNFETYISQNKKIKLPDFTNGNEVQLTFSINRKGRPVNIKVERALSPDADAEAIRLLKDGPAWKYTTSRKDKATIMIKF